MKLDIQLFASGLEDDQNLNIKYVGEFEGLDSNGNKINYYIKISEYVGKLYEEDNSMMIVSCWTTPNVGTWNSVRRPNDSVYVHFFTNYGNNNHYYQELTFNDVKYVFTPAGILTFKNIKTMYSFASRSWITYFETYNVNENAFIPTLSIGRTPTGLDETSFEQVNMLTSKRKNSFLGTSSATKYKLSETDLNTVTVKAEILQSDGTYLTKTEGSGLTVNRTTGEITFIVAPGVSPVPGQDNVIITYGKDNLKDYVVSRTDSSREIKYTYTLTESIDSNLVGVLVEGTLSSGTQFVEGDGHVTVNRNTRIVTVDATVYNAMQSETDPQISFSYSSTYTLPNESYLICYQHAVNVISYNYEEDKRIFVNDGTNRDFYSATNDISYFPDSNYTVMGDESGIIGYGRNNGYLFTFKKGKDSVFVRQGSTINDVVVFPSISDEPNVEVLGKPIETSVDELLVPTTDGIERFYFYNSTIRHEVRSYYIDNQLPKKLEEWDGYNSYIDDNFVYFILPDGRCFVGDLLQKTYSQEGSSPSGSRYGTTLQYQYEWYLWNDMPNGIMKQFYHDNLVEMYIYDINGMYHLNYGSPKCDKLYNINTDQYQYIPIQSYFETPYLDFNQINMAKTIKNLYLNTRSKDGDYFEIGYKLPDGQVNILEQQYSMLQDDFPKLIQIKANIKKFMNVKLYIKSRPVLMDNVMPINFETSTTWGVTITNNEDGSITLNGKSTAPFSIEKSLQLTSFDMYRNTNYTLANDRPLKYGLELYMDFYGITQLHTNVRLTYNQMSYSFKTPINEQQWPLTTLRCYLKISPGVTFNNYVIKPSLTTIQPVSEQDSEQFKNTTFNRLLIEYQQSGKYRGD